MLLIVCNRQLIPGLVTIIRPVIVWTQLSGQVIVGKRVRIRQRYILLQLLLLLRLALQAADRRRLLDDVEALVEAQTARIGLEAYLDDVVLVVMSGKGVLVVESKPRNWHERHAVISCGDGEVFIRTGACQRFFAATGKCKL